MDTNINSNNKKDQRRLILPKSVKLRIFQTILCLLELV